ncbi:hypothetical protein EON64_19025, partial [archaeon]
MSCEVLCCEVPELLQLLVNADDHAFLAQLLRLLEHEGELNCYLAGYFEKILEMLFRTMTRDLMDYFNRYCEIHSPVEPLALEEGEEGEDTRLFERFLRHVSNYSIMQVVQRLLLPHIPFNAPPDLLPQGADGTHEPACLWSFSGRVCRLLVSEMLTSPHTEVSLHVSDLLITVLQLSPPDTVLVRHLCTDSVLHRLFSLAVQPHVPGELLGGEGEGG